MITQTQSRWKQIIKEKNLDISIVDIDDLPKDKRIDPEFYVPEIVKLRTYLKKEKKAKPLSYFVEYIKRGTQPLYEDNGEIKVLRSVNVRENGLNEIRQEFISRKFYKSKLQGQTQKNDILLTSTGVGTLGRAGFISDDEEFFIDGHIAILRKIRILLPEFVFIFLNSSVGQAQINTLYKGSSGQIELYPDDISEILIPETNFQEKISEMVQEAHRERELSKKLYAEAENILLEELDLKDWKPTEKNIAIKDSEEVKLFERCDAEFFQLKYDEIIQKIKNYSGGWDILENCIEVKSGLLKIKSEKKYQYCELADIDASLGLVGNFTEIFGKELPSRARMKIEKNNVVVSSVAGSSKKVALITNKSENLVASTGFFILKPKLFLPEVNLILMKSFIYQEFLQRSARGMILSATIKDDFKKFPIPKLSKELQEKISEKIKNSHIAREKSETLLANAKKAVEIFIEEDEERAEEFLKV